MMTRRIAVLFCAVVGGVIAGEALTIPRLVDIAEPKVVKLGVISDGASGVCSGAIISPSGLVLTCAHCFSHGGVRKLFVKTSSEAIYQGEIVRFDPVHDLALVQMTGVRQVAYFRVGHMPKIGDHVMALGSPLGLQHTASVGWVENILRMDQRIAIRANVLIVHSAGTNPGNSGGPLINLKGELVGVNEAVLMLNKWAPASGLYLAISADDVREFIGSRNGN